MVACATTTFCGNDYRENVVCLVQLLQNSANRALQGVDLAVKPGSTPWEEENTLINLMGTMSGLSATEAVNISSRIPPIDFLSKLYY